MMSNKSIYQVNNKPNTSQPHTNVHWSAYKDDQKLNKRYSLCERFVPSWEKLLPKYAEYWQCVGWFTNSNGELMCIEFDSDYLWFWIEHQLTFEPEFAVEALTLYVKYIQEKPERERLAAIQSTDANTLLIEGLRKMGMSEENIQSQLEILSTPTKQPKTTSARTRKA